MPHKDITDAAVRLQSQYKDDLEDTFPDEFCQYAKFLLADEGTLTLKSVQTLYIKLWYQMI